MHFLLLKKIHWKDIVWKRNSERTEKAHHTRAGSPQCGRWTAEDGHTWAAAITPGSRAPCAAVIPPRLTCACNVPTTFVYNGHIHCINYSYVLIYLSIFGPVTSNSNKLNSNRSSSYYYYTIVGALKKTLGINTVHESGTQHFPKTVQKSCKVWNNKMRARLDTWLDLEVLCKKKWLDSRKYHVRRVGPYWYDGGIK